MNANGSCTVRYGMVVRFKAVAVVANRGVP